MRESLPMALDIRYVRSGGVSIAYQVVGEGDQDLVFVPDFCSNLVYAWESPYWRPFYERLARSFPAEARRARTFLACDRWASAKPSVPKSVRPVSIAPIRTERGA